MPRSWTWIDDTTEKTEEEIDKVTPLLDSLAREWSSLHDEEEQRRFARQSDIDENREYEPEDEADSYRVQEMRRLHQEQESARLDSITSALARHGARMMRPYEHWNEDEQYMKYMESDRFGDSCY